MNLILFDDMQRNRLLPLTHTRPAADIRCGILTMRSRWEKVLDCSPSSTLTVDYLAAAFPSYHQEMQWYVNGRIFADAALSEAVKGLGAEALLRAGNTILAIHTGKKFSSIAELLDESTNLKQVTYPHPISELREVWDIFQKNEPALRADFNLLTQGRTGAPIPQYVTAVSPEQIFIEPGAKLNPCVLNASTGPIYLDTGSEVMEGCLVRGGLSLGANAVLKMGAKVYGFTTIGPGSKVGGEVNNVVIFNDSNKGHDGFIGNAVIGEWCNLGADTNCSNLKNNYDEVMIWSEADAQLVPTGLQFCGLIMGDHSKCGINTMFNTGTVVGVSSNIFGAGFPEKFIPSFSWGSAGNWTTYRLEKAIDTANRMMARRGKTLTEAQVNIFRHIFESGAAQRGNP